MCERIDARRTRSGSWGVMDFRNRLRRAREREIEMLQDEARLVNFRRVRDSRQRGMLFRE